MILANVDIIIGEFLLADELCTMVPRSHSRIESSKKCNFDGHCAYCTTYNHPLDTTPNGCNLPIHVNTFSDIQKELTNTSYLLVVVATFCLRDFPYWCKLFMYILPFPPLFFNFHLITYYKKRFWGS